MNKFAYNGIDIFNPIAGKMQYFVDAFAKVYGEQYRNIIEQRLNNAQYFFEGGDCNNIVAAIKYNRDEEVKKVNDLNLDLSTKKSEINKIVNYHDFFNYQFINDINNQSKIVDLYKKNISSLLYQKIKNIQAKNGVTKYYQYSNLINCYFDLIVLSKDKLLKNSALLSINKQNEFRQLFTALGYPNYKDFKYFLNNENLLNDIFDNNILIMINYWTKQYQEEIDTSNIRYVNFFNKFKELEIVDNKDNILKVFKDYINNKTANSAFVISCTTNKGFTSLCMCKNALELNLETLTHEMGHIIDNTPLKNNKNGYRNKIGFELFYDNNQKSNQKSNNINSYSPENTRLTELFNEIVNEYFTQKVAHELKQTEKAFTLCEKFNTKSIYNNGVEIFKDFIEKYQDKLIECKMTADENNKAYKYFGTKNLNNLMNIAKVYTTKRLNLHRQQLKGLDVSKQIALLNSSTKEIIKDIDRQIEKRNKVKKFFAFNTQKDNLSM